MSFNGRNKSHILLVDDERVALAMISKGLTKYGYMVVTAESVDEAEVEIARVKPDLVILDISMPGKNGLVLAKQLSHNQIPFILLTAFSQPDFVEKATDYGALGYLVKPIAVKQLIPAINAALAQAKDIRSVKTSEAQLRGALNGERDISIAVGITMMKYHLDRQAAFELLRTTARNLNHKLIDLATEVILESESFNVKYRASVD